jgi:Ca-activated chloride channel family protein
MDYLFVRLMLHDLHINEGDMAGTNIVNALAEMRRQYFSQPSPKLKTLILLSDGGDTQIESLSGAERQKAINGMLNLVSNGEQLNLRTYTIGIGSKEGTTIPDINYEGQPVKSRLEEDVLRKIAQRGRGTYYYANDYSPYDLAQDLYKRMQEDPQYYDESQGADVILRSLAGGSGLVYDRYYQYPLSIAILCLGLALFLPDALRKKEDAWGEAG